MPLKQMFGLRRTRGVLIDSVLMVEPMGGSATQHEVQTYENMYEQSFTPQTMVAGGQIRYITMSLTFDSNLHSLCAFFKDGIRVSEEIQCDATARDYTFTFIIDSTKGVTLSLRSRDESTGASTDTGTVTNVVFTAGMMAMTA